MDGSTIEAEKLLMLILILILIIEFKPEEWTGGANHFEIYSNLVDDL